MPIDINTLSKEDLVSLKNDVEKALKSIDARRKAEAKKAADDVAREFGFSLDELVSNDGKSPKGVPRFANPEDASQTWTGRGRKPNWVNAWLESGRDLADLEL